MRTRASSEFSNSHGSVRAHTGDRLDHGWSTAEGLGREFGGVLHILPQALVVEPPVVVPANAFLAALNGLRLLAPVTLLRGLATAFGASPAKAVYALLEASTKAFLVPLVRSGLIEGGTVLRLAM